MDNKIDFIITWVDDSDPKWRKEFEYYSAKEERTINTDACRYRDWDTLRYWFRGVEKFAPWVNKIYFVTYGHLPKWLNTDNSKLVIVKHEDFIPHEYLPTFNSYAIEFFFHKIKGLSDRFVYFNDDMFILSPVSSDIFFRRGLPCDIAILDSIAKYGGMFGTTVFLAIDLINKNFDKRTSIKENLMKWYNPASFRTMIHNFIYYRHSKFPGFYDHHLPQSYLKKTYNAVWNNCMHDLKKTCSDKFRSYGNIAHWLIRYWQLASGNFTPYNMNKYGKVYFLKEKNLTESIDCITHQKKKIICLNDGEHVTNFEDYKKRILRAFDQILPEKSSFEL